MPVTPRSRYASLPPEQASAADGSLRTVLPIRRHHGVPPSSARHTHMVTGTETLEYLAWRYQGSSDGWWRVADGNPLRFPLDWRPGQRIEVVANGTPGLVVRDRRF